MWVVAVSMLAGTFKIVVNHLLHVNLPRSSSMDFGFGSRNQEIGNAAANALLHGARAEEQAIDAELAQYDKLLDDDDALEDLRQRRLAKLVKQHEQHKRWKDLGHSVYEDLGGRHDSRDVAKEFFGASKLSERMVVHFYRPSTRFCDVFHSHLQKLSTQPIINKLRDKRDRMIVVFG